jgi:hypothetical protein
MEAAAALIASRIVSEEDFRNGNHIDGYIDNTIYLL